MPLVYLTQVSALMDVKRGWMYCQLTAATEPKPNAVYNLKDSHNKCVSKGGFSLAWRHLDHRAIMGILFTANVVMLTRCHGI